MKAEELRDIVDVCRMLGDPTRVSIVTLVAKGPRSVGELCDKLKLRQPTVSHHLALLRMSRLVERQRKGKKQIYSLNRAKLTPVKKFVGKLK